MIDVLERSGLRGRGGAWFPTARKWKAVAGNAVHTPAVVAVNLSEGEPLSAKDRGLGLHRPHLILDGAQIAAETLDAEEIVLYLPRPDRALETVLRRATRERDPGGAPVTGIRIVRTPHRYVSGESSALVRRANGGPAKPTFPPPHASERGIRGQPTLVQNAETMAHVALITRFGDGWFRERGTPVAPGTALLTACGNVRRPGVYEVDLDSPLLDALHHAGGCPARPGGVLVGGYFGTWLGPAGLPEVRLSPEAVTLGCGVIGVLDAEGCGLAESARIVEYLARESAGQCGCCVHGLPAVAGAMRRLATSRGDRGDLESLRRWTGQLRGRGGCHHPDGAIANLSSALEAFGEHLPAHLAGIPCPGAQRSCLPSPPHARTRWG